MYQRLLLILAFSLSAIIATAQDKGLYLGVQANGGFTSDQNYEHYSFPFNKTHGETGVTGTFMFENFMGIATGAMYNKFEFDVQDQDGRLIGRQFLNYWRVPVGVRFAFANPKEHHRVRFDFYGGFSLYLLQDANYVAGSYSGRYGPTFSDHTTQNFHSVGIGAYTGCGMSIHLGGPCYLSLGSQLAGAFGNQNKDGYIQGYPMIASLTSFTFNLGFQMCLFSYGKKGFWSGR